VGYIESPNMVVFALLDELDMNVILQSLPPIYKSFILNFHMNNMEKTFSKWHEMLKTIEESMKKNSNHVTMV
jgi:hypothetical protein